MPNGSLNDWLHLHDYCLDTLQRKRIRIDVANALEYLCYGQDTTIVHCNLKPSNVLLDEDMIAQVSDFGIAKLLQYRNVQTAIITSVLVVYCAAYGSEGTISPKGVCTMGFC
ncbi:Protein kinase domain-containing protein [Heracleum sosnowskyi]|uniref:Protein kinase domain-containing protein n=1 Tax=Heracleum sosnowskyi TaxID=360622 RepID=A0AAD8H8N9_9APIA|nr:Protein kinase domain-containing protein [Heracleum sosnowskyi]